MFSNDRHAQSGNAIFIVLIAIVVLGLLTNMLSKTSEQQADGLSRETRQIDVERLLNHAGVLSLTVNNMIANGTDPDDVTAIKSGDAGFTTAPHQAKIYHPLGGGIAYIDELGSATDFIIAMDQTITGLGSSDALNTGAEIVFVAQVPQSLCAAINDRLLGSSTIPTMTDANFTVFIADSGAQVITAGICASCVNAPRQCVGNVAGTGFAYYDAMYLR